MKKQSFVFGAILLAVSGIFCKLLGAIYKIPLTNILGSQGMGIYYLIFPVYAFFITFSSNSFTTAISKMVSKQIAENKNLLGYKTFKASLILLSFLGFALGIILSSFSYLIASLQGLESAYICYLIIAPSILLVSVISSFKGYFQGLQNMTPTAVGQILEQLVKLSAGFLFAKILGKQGILFGTMGALLGVTLSEFVTVVFFVLYFTFFKRRTKIYLDFSKATDYEKQVSLKVLIKEVFKTSIPFTLSSIILPMSLVIDSFLIINILKSMHFDKGFATSLLGLNSGVVNTLVGLPSTLSVAICMTIIPYISFALSKKDFKGINQKTELAVKLTLLIAIPCVLVFAFFSTQIITLLYGGTFESIYELKVAASLLTISSINVLYLSLLQISTALLQSINKAYIPVASLAVSLIVKVLCEVFLINNPYLNIAGAVISNTVCYFVSAVINIYYFRKNILLKFSFYRTIVCPIIAGLSMCFLIFLSFNVLQTFLGFSLSVIFSFVLGGVFYLILVFILKTFTVEEQNSIMFFKKFKTKKIENKS